MFQLPELYSTHLKKQFNTPQYLLLLIVINLIQSMEGVVLEEIARRLPIPILLRSRIKKLQRFLSLEQFKIEIIWVPILITWVKQEWLKQELLDLVIDRSPWRDLNLLMVSILSF